MTRQANPSVVALSETAPLLLAVGCTVAACLVGIYRGMPLVDRVGGRSGHDSTRTPVEVAT